MRSILETCTPKPEILGGTGTFNPEIYTASLSRAMEHYRGRGRAVHSIYTDAEQFFTQATDATDSMRMVLSEVMARVDGNTLGCPRSIVSRRPSAAARPIPRSPSRTSHFVAAS